MLRFLKCLGPLRITGTNTAVLESEGKSLDWRPERFS
jgi:hypothetical protein